MQPQTDREVLATFLSRVRRRIFFNTASAWLVRSGLLMLPLAALIIAADQRWNQGRASLAIAAISILGSVLFAFVAGLYGLGARVQSALKLDQGGHLKDRVSSAWEFLEAKELDEARQVQVRDAIRHVEALDLKKALSFPKLRLSGLLPVGALLFILSFFVPPLAPPVQAHLIDPVKALQLQQLEELKQELAAKKEVPQELEEVLKKLEEITKKFQQGEIGERDLMLQLGRLDESLRAKIAQIGLENLEQEMSAIVPHLMANAATLDLAQALKEQKFDKAAHEVQNLADKVAADKVSKDEKKKLAAHLGASAAKLGKKKDSDSFSGDLAEASEALEKSDNEGFKSACKNMGNKLGLLKKCQGMKQACNKLGLCKSSLGQCASECNNIALGKTFGKGKGGKGAGTATTGDPFGDPTRLADGLKKMVQISGQAG
ncbi:MAG: hypothetical protein L0Z50_38835, partial [Verrucomicrobiales bacterium]|nr:hypothetical protein [Verrucomicrobiales bacterium]